MRTIRCMTLPVALAIDYYLAAIAAVRTNKERYAAAEAQLREEVRSGHRFWSWDDEADMPF